MLEIFTEQKFLLTTLFLVILGAAGYYSRVKTRKNETPQQRLMKDLHMVVAIFFAFAFLTFALMMNSEYIWTQSRE